MKLCLNFLFHSYVVGVLCMRDFHLHLQGSFLPILLVQRIEEEKEKKKLFYLAKIYGKISKLSLDFAILSKLFKEYKGHIKPLENLFALAFISIFFQGKLQIKPLKFGSNWILHFEVSEFRFYPITFGGVWILHHDVSEFGFYPLIFQKCLDFTP